MLYEEFLKGTGASECEESYEQYKAIEAVYNGSDITKEDAYRLWKRTVGKKIKRERKAIIEALNEDIPNVLSDNKDCWGDNYLWAGEGCFPKVIRDWLESVKWQGEVINHRLGVYGISLRIDDRNRLCGTDHRGRFYRAFTLSVFCGKKVWRFPVRLS